MLNELRVASTLLQDSIDRYAKACNSIKHSQLGVSQVEGLASFTLATELHQLAAYEAKLRESKAAIARYVNLCTSIVPANRLPSETLLRVFRLLVDMEHRKPFSSLQGIPKYPLILSHVCIAWRNIILRSPSLWSRIRISSDLRTDEFLKSYTDFHSGQTKEALLDILVSDSFDSRTRKAPSLSTFVVPFAGRIRSLELQLTIDEDPLVTTVGDLIAKSLEASSNTLERFALSAYPTDPENLFIESSSRGSNNLITYLSHDQLEAILSRIDDLWLRGLYFNWESKAYHGLTALQLEHCYAASISEPQLISILASSPQLKWLDIGLDIIQTVATPDLPSIYLPELELFVGSVLLLRLIRPGSNELTVSIIGNDGKPGMLYDAKVKDFFSCANMVNFYSDGFLDHISGVNSLLSFAPRLRVLAVSHIELSGASLDITTHNSLDTVYLLDGCTLEWPLLREMVTRWNIKRLVFWGKNYISRDEPKTIDSQKALEDELSDLPVKDIQLEFVPGNGPCPMDLFVGPSSK
ncbi:unnamed protein product [Rhizoctonia solani]|uniref:F-box domain-containing protein n=1 Tax=Rhizoctonia solani TaxID=456999 RepID=A0A8H3AC91_9AGAM|nr:unnamed protein product [Rhizoctonia solani]